MTIKPLIILPDPILRQVSKPIETIDGEVKKLADDMLETMYDAPGIGLAAIQIGVARRMLVLDVSKDGEDKQPLVFINPEIVASTDARSVYEEGCLSIPEQYADVQRPASVTVTWMDETGASQEETFEGLWATCVQHEIDHLNGKLFIDYLGLMKRQMITRKMEKLKREKARAGK